VVGTDRSTDVGVAALPGQTQKPSVFAHEQYGFNVRLKI
jgi:hypothetical protein